MGVEKTNFFSFELRKNYINLQFTAVLNDNLGSSAASLGTVALDLLDDIQTLNNRAEDGMLAIQPGGLDSADEELGSVGVGSSVGHGEDTRSSVLEDEVLISELLTVDGLATSAVASGEVCKIEKIRHEIL